MSRETEIAIVGAGAAGLMAAIFAARSGKRVIVLEGAPRIGAKILISGGGRCNVTHDVVKPEDFNGNRNAIGKVLRTFNVEQTVAFFEELAVTLKREETGKLFPVTDRARTVLDALVNAASDAGAEIVTGCRVEAIERGFLLRTSQGDIQAKKVILATGGQSVPKTGSDGHGYVLARALGHTTTNTFPALVPLLIEDEHWTKQLSGTSVIAELSVRDGRVLQRETGSMLFTHFGLSGPVVLDISRHWIASGGALFANFLPAETFESVERALLEEAKKNPRATGASFLRGRVPEKIANVIGGTSMLSKLTREERKKLARDLTEQRLPVTRDRGFEYAEVTAGGVPLKEVELATMASRACEGLHLCGEILDVDGKIGGYNFQWAWASGRLAGLGSAR